MKVIIAGSRTFNNYNFLCEKIDNLQLAIDEIVCGGAKGADLLGKKYAEEHNIPVKIFLPDWKKYNRGAGMIRNRQMGEYADYLIAFWDKKSHGTKNMIDYMKKNNKHGSVFLF